MAKLRGLQLVTFMSAVSPEVLARYFSQSPLRDAVQQWFHLNPSAFQRFAAAPENAESAALILHDFDSVDSLCREGAGLVFRAYARFNLRYNEHLNPQELAMLLFLDNRAAFDFARSRYLLYGGGATLSVYALTGSNVSVGQEELDSFADDVRTWFAGHAKGDNMILKSFEDSGEVILLIQRGALIETRPYWEGVADIAVSSMRPAIEDVLIFDPESSELRIKAGLVTDRAKYLDAFCRHMAGDEDLAERARAEQTFSLEPVRSGRFNYRGRGAVRLVELVGVKIQLRGASKAILNIRADDVLRTFKYDLKSLSLDSGHLVSATFRFQVQIAGERRATPLTFTVNPPSRTDIGERKYADIVLRYLKDQGVKLR